MGSFSRLRLGKSGKAEREPHPDHNHKCVSLLSNPMSKLFSMSLAYSQSSCSIDLSVESAFARPWKNFFPCHSLTRSLHAPFMVYSWCVHTLTTPKPLIFVKIFDKLFCIPSIFYLRDIIYRRQVVSSLGR